MKLNIGNILLLLYKTIIIQSAYEIKEGKIKTITKIILGSFCLMLIFPSMLKAEDPAVANWLTRYNGLGNYEDWASSMTSNKLGNAFVTGASYEKGSDDDYTTIKYSSFEDIIPQVHFIYTQTSEFAIVYGKAFIGNKQIEPGDWIGVFALDVVVNDGCIGAIEITQDGNYSVTIYGDDPTTEEKDGAGQEDALSFKVMDKDTGNIMDLYPIGPNEAKWTTHNEVLNIDLVTGQKIPLAQGWNLISFQVGKCIYEQQTPILSIIDPNSVIQIEIERKNSLKAWLLDDQNSPIRDSADSNKVGEWQRITAFDENGGLLLDKDIPEFANSLHYLSCGYGYWIKMNESGFLLLKGRFISPDVILNLKKGWNLAGYIPADICYAESEESKASICPYVTGIYQTEEEIALCPVNPFPNTLFASITEKYRRITSFDQCNGAMIHDTELPFL